MTDHMGKTINGVGCNLEAFNVKQILISENIKHSQFC